MNYLVTIYSQDGSILKEHKIFALTWNEAREEASYWMVGWLDKNHIYEIGGWALDRDRRNRK